MREEMLPYKHRSLDATVYYDLYVCLHGRTSSRRIVESPTLSAACSLPRSDALLASPWKIVGVKGNKKLPESGICWSATLLSLSLLNIRVRTFSLSSSLLVLLIPRRSASRYLEMLGLMEG